jgi:hypothetical protein
VPPATARLGSGVSAEDPNRADPASERLVLRIDLPEGLSNHKGGWLGFGPDGRLYVATGDGGGGPFGNGQNPGTLLGKILRLDVEQDGFPADPARNYALPADNPFVSGDAGPRRFRAGTTGAHRATGYLARRPRVIRDCVWRIAAALN